MLLKISAGYIWIHYGKEVALIIESLYENLSNANNAVNFAMVKFLLQDSKSFLHAFSIRSNEGGVLSRFFIQVNKLLQTFAEVKAKLTPSSSESTMNKKQEDISLMKFHNQEITVLLSCHLFQPNKHQEI
jgi:hypothetical protein